MFTIHIYRVEESVRKGVEPVCTTLYQDFADKKTALKQAHLIAVQDSKDMLGEKQSIEFHPNGYYQVYSYWGRTEIWITDSETHGKSL